MVTATVVQVEVVTHRGPRSSGESWPFVIVFVTVLVVVVVTVLVVVRVTVFVHDVVAVVPTPLISRAMIADFPS
jgi:hypothetical protein